LKKVTGTVNRALDHLARYDFERVSELDPRDAINALKVIDDIARRGYGLDVSANGPQTLVQVVVSDGKAVELKQSSNTLEG
jgi:hypothetical protein